MTDELKVAIDSLYLTFFDYPLNPVMEGCPCCVLNSDKEKLHFKDLRQLGEEDLFNYAGKAMTTWGDVIDFKHYLPRIFELLATGNSLISSFIVLEKLDYGKWRSWEQAEQNCIINFLYAWWADLITCETGKCIDVFFEIYVLTGSIDELLDRWVVDFENYSFLNYVDFVYANYSNLKYKNKPFKEFDNASIEKLIKWIDEKSNMLEGAFFHYTQTDGYLAEKISRTLYIIETLNNG